MRQLRSIALGFFCTLVLLTGCSYIARSIGEFVGAKAIEQLGKHDDRLGTLEAIVETLQARMEEARTAGSFPWNILLGFTALGGGVAAVMLFFGPTRAFAGVAFAGGVLLGTAVVVKLMFWQILLGVLGLVVLAALGIALYALFTRGALRKVVSSFESKAQADSAFNVGIKDAMTAADGQPVLTKAESNLVDKLRGK